MLKSLANEINNILSDNVVKTEKIKELEEKIAELENNSVANEEVNILNEKITNLNEEITRLNNQNSSLNAEFVLCRPARPDRLSPAFSLTIFPVLALRQDASLRGG